MTLGSAILALPLALGGESGGGESTGLAVISLISIVAGYVLIAALWYFIFRGRARSKRRGGGSD
jgi:hypothetical protein